MIDFLVIGAQRGGTQSFYKYLLQHHAVVPATKPDIQFFDLHFEQGWDWYLRHFPLLNGYYGPNRISGHITGEASPLYFHHPLAAERIKHHLPHAKLIVLLRNPTDRAYSHYRQAVRLGKETLSFLMALKMEAKRSEKGLQRIRENPRIYAERNVAHAYIGHGLYAPQIRRWLSYFPREQLLFIRSEDFFADPLPQVEAAYAFLGLSGYRPNVEPPPASSFFECLTEGTRTKIDRFFQQSNEEVGRLLHWNPAWDATPQITAK